MSGFLPPFGVTIVPRNSMRQTAVYSRLNHHTPRRAGYGDSIEEVYCTVGFTTGISAMKQQLDRPKGRSIKPHCE
jgi:hypothetical protein